MLIEFRVANYRSIREEQALSMVASASTELADSHTFESGLPKGKLLPSVAIYGPNASGKTNLLRALRMMRGIVVTSATQTHRGKPLSVKPFLLDLTSSDKPTTVEVDFIAEGVRYQYGFSATAERVMEEWLFAFPERRLQRWFEREWKNGKYQWNLGTLLKGEKKLWQKSTRDNALFLSTAVQLNSQQLQPVYDWFGGKLNIQGIMGWSPIDSSMLCQKEGSEKVLRFLKQADLGIDDIHIETESFDIESLSEHFFSRNSGTLNIEMKDRKIYKPKTIHKKPTGGQVEFDLSEESEGTQKMFSIAGPFLSGLNSGEIIFIDELHDNLHPTLVKFLVSLFNNKKTNPHNAQIIFTTHETSMLDQELLRRDQIWFCERDENQATKLYPLSDFHLRKGVTDIESAYLSGRYGALPYIKAS